MKLNLVQAKVSDIEFLLTLREAAMGRYLSESGLSNDREYNLQRVLYNFENAKLVIVNQKPVGLLKARFVQDKHHWYLVQIQLLPEYQRLGIGKNLIEDLLNVASTQGHSVVLSVLKNNPAKRLYESLGFKKYDESEFEYLMEYKA